MKVRMKGKVLSPGVQDRRHPNLCSQALGVGGQCQQCLGSGLEKQVIQPPRMMKHQWVQGRRQREDDVEVLHGEQTLQARFQPGRAFGGLALGAVSVPAGVV